MPVQPVIGHSSHSFVEIFLSILRDLTGSFAFICTAWHVIACPFVCILEQNTIRYIYVWLFSYPIIHFIVALQENMELGSLLAIMNV